MKKKTRPGQWEAVEQNVDHPWKFKVVDKDTGKVDFETWPTRESAEKAAGRRNDCSY